MLMTTVGTLSVAGEKNQYVILLSTSLRVLWNQQLGKYFMNQVKTNGICFFFVFLL